MGFAPSNLASKKFILKFVELVMVFIVMMIFRLGGGAPSHVFSWGNDTDSSIFGIMTSVGYFYFIIILLVGIAMGDNNKHTLLLFNIFGFLFFIAIGSEQIRVWGKLPYSALSQQHTANGMGAMAILTSFVFLVDTVFSVLDLRNGE